MPVSVIENASFGNSGIVTANGIKFPATQVASADANVLDDYEEGTWTPTAYGQASTGTTTYGTRTAFYTKIGNQVTASFYMVVTGMTGTGVLNLGGLPFTSSSALQTGSCMTNGLPYPSSLTAPVVYLAPSRTYLEIYVSASNTGWANVQTDAAYEIIATITYLAA
jgi:hypothetical protein